MHSLAEDLGVVFAGARACWPQEPGCYTEDDFHIDPQSGIAVVACGMGAAGAQACASSKLAVWSIVGERKAMRPRQTAEQGMLQGFARADEAVNRLTATWPEQLRAPKVTLAALQLDGNQALIAHVGNCRVSRLGPTGVIPLTEDHTLAREYREAGGNSQALQPMQAQLVTRVLGRADVKPEIKRITVRAGDRFLISTYRLHSLLSDAELHTCTASAHRGAPSLAGLRDHLLSQAKKKSPDFGVVTFILLEVKNHGTDRSPAGSSSPPHCAWLYQPGRELAVPPPYWRKGGSGHGPEERWFTEVWGAVMGMDWPQLRTITV